MRRIRRENYTLTASGRLCSLHFVESDFVKESVDKTRKRGALNRRRLKKNAIPSKFHNLPSYLSYDVPLERPTSGTAAKRQELDNGNTTQLVNDMRISYCV